MFIYIRGGDCIQFVPSTYLMVYNQCNGKNNCQITVPIFTIADFQGRLSSYLHLTYTPSTCGVFNKSIFFIKKRDMALNKLKKQVTILDFRILFRNTSPTCF